jgi:hypothetical protein
LTVFIVPVQSDLFKLFVIVPSVKVIVLLIKFDIPVTVKEPSNVFNEYKLGVIIDDGVMIVELLFVSCIDKVGFSSVKVNELHKREPDEDPEILFELIIF